MDTNLKNLQSNKKAKTFLIITIICLVFGLFVLSIIPNASTCANAATIPSGSTNLLSNNGLLLDTENTEIMNIYSNYAEAYAYLTAATNIYSTASKGDYNLLNWGSPQFSDNFDMGGGNIAKVTVNSLDYYGFTLKTTTVPVNAEITVNIPIDSNSALARAIRDDMLEVQISASCKQVSLNQASGEDTASATLYYCAGTSAAEINLTDSHQIRFPVKPDSTLNYEVTDVGSVPNSCENGSYLSLRMSNFSQTGDNFFMAITQFFFKIKISLRTGVVFETYDNYDNIQIQNTDNSRSEFATQNMVKEGDVVVVKNELRNDANIYDVNSGISLDTRASGSYYRELFLESRYGTSKTEINQGSSLYTSQDMVTWTYNENAFTRIYPDDVDGIDLSNEYTGLYAVFRVNGGIFTQLTIACSLKSNLGITLQSGSSYNFIVDNQKANTPILDTYTVFYQKYIDEKSYYTNTNSYNTEIDEGGNIKVASVSIGTDRDNTDINLSSFTTNPRGISPELIYYKVTKLEFETNNIEYTPFSKEDATGIFCKITPQLNNEAPIINYFGIDLNLKTGTNEYLEEGIYEVEFVTYDYVGNITYSNIPYVIRVDVSDYAFSTVTKVGNTIVTDMVSSGVFALTSYALSDDNQLVTRANNTYKRGDRVVLKLDFSSTGFTKYILTGFGTPAGDEINTATFPYTVAGVVFITNYQQSQSMPTFIVSSGYAGDENEGNRKLILTFKSKITIAVTNTIHTYVPNTHCAVTATAIDSTTGRSLNVTIIKTYCETIDGNFRPVDSTFPINAGTYYYRCEINSSQYYGFNTGTLNIKKSVPIINNVNIIPIKYGESLATRDTIFNVSLNKYIPTDNITCLYSYYDENLHSYSNTPSYMRSSDGVFGYFSIADPSPFEVGDLYKKPTAGTKNLKIKFTPIDMIDINTPSYDSNGNFIVNTNYNSVTISNVSLTVRHSTDVNLTVNNLNEEGVVVSEYNNLMQNIDLAITAIDGVDALGEPRSIELEDFLIYSYSTDGINFNGTQPIDAGNYTVKFSLDTTNEQCNYTGTWNQDFVIEKRKLSVYAKDTIFDFQKESIPVVYAQRIDGVNHQDYYSLKYLYKFYYYDTSIIDWTFEKNAIDDYLVPEDSQHKFEGLPCNAGRYIVKIGINELNYENEFPKFINYTINKVSILDGVNVKFSYPSLSWINSTINNHLSYLEELGSVEFNITNTTIIQYYYHYLDLGKVKHQWQEIPGTFVMSHTTYDGDYSIESVADFVAAEKSYVGLDVGTFAGYMYFIPQDDYLINFDLLYIQYNINVGKAEPIFTDIVVDSKNYGDEIAGIGDMNISKSVKFKLNNNEYTTIPSDQYSYAIYSMESGILTAGNHNVIVTFMPNDTIRFAEMQGTINLNINAKDISINLNTEGYNIQSEVIAGQTKDVYNTNYKGNSRVGYSFNVEELVYSYIIPQCEYKIYKFDDNNFENSSSLYSNSILVVGKYKVVIECLDKNYNASTSYYLSVNKTNLVKNIDPSINQVSTSVAYGNLLKSVNFSGGQVVSKETGENISGHFEFNCFENATFDEVGIKVFKLQFVPSDVINYEIYTGKLDNNNQFAYYTVSVNVSRADLSTNMTFAINDIYTYGDWNYDLDLSTITTFTTPIYTNGILCNSNKVDDTYKFLNVTYSINNRPLVGKYNAGVYNIVVNIDETKQVFYKGSKSVETTLQKQTATILPTISYKVFNNKTQTLGCEIYQCNSEGVIPENASLLYEQTSKVYYQSNNVAMENPPINIGQYYVKIRLNSQNYEYYDVNPPLFPLTIGVNNTQIIVNNLNQVFANPRALVVSLGGNNAIYSLSYLKVISGVLEINENGIRVDNTAEVVVTDKMPTNAGNYYLMFNFDSSSNSGYNQSIIFDQQLIIDKCEATIMTDEIFCTTYTNSPYLFTIRTEPYNLNYDITYCAQDSEVFVSEEVLFANTNDSYHQVKITINNNNYKGTKIVRYSISPASLRIETNPVFNSYSYNSENAPTVATNGNLRFGDIENIEGVYLVDINSINSLDVGQYKINYTFTPYTDENVVDTNFYSINGTTNLNIVKKVISEANIVIDSSQQLNVEYNMQYKPINVVLNDFDVYDINGLNQDFKIKTKYNGDLTPVRARGEYVISAIVDSKNYSGSVVFANHLIIGMGIPYIKVMPTTTQATNLQIAKVGEDYIFPSLNNANILAGEAYIKNTNNRLNGTFALSGSGQTTKANTNIIEVLFTPQDTNFSSVIIDMEVNVVGFDLITRDDNSSFTAFDDWTYLTLRINDIKSGGIIRDVKIQAIPNGSNLKYGVSLDNYTLRFVPVSVGGDIGTVNELGELTFVNSSAIPSVGEAVAISFVPYGDVNINYFNNVANNMLATIIPELQKEQFSASWEWNLVGFEGKTFNEKHRLDINNTLDNTELQLSPNVFTLYIDDTKNTQFDLNSAMSFAQNGMQIYLVAEFTNYSNFEGYVTLKVRQELRESNIIINNTNKEYSGLPISLSDFDIEVGILDANIIYYIYDSENNLCDGVEIGSYRVEIIVYNDTYYGRKEIPSYVVARKDISEYITLNTYSTLFNSIVLPKVVYNGSNLSEDFYNLSYKQINASSYTGNLSNIANKYKVMVIIDSDYYIGEKVFDFEVKAILIDVVVLPINAIYNSIESYRAITVDLYKHNTSEVVGLDYTLYYYSSNYSFTTTRPVNVDNYTVRLVLNDTNYLPNYEKGYIEFSYILQKASLEVRENEYPQISVIEVINGINYNLKYGQKFSDIKLVGGVARNNNLPINGEYVVDDGNILPNAGINVIRLKFVPSNHNYDYAYIEKNVMVSKGNAQVIVSNLYAKYDGTSKINWLVSTVQPSGISYKIVYKKPNGEVVENPISAGSYFVNVTSLSDNYNVTITTSGTEIITPSLIIAKAQVLKNSDNSYKVLAPKAFPISCGDSLTKSSLSREAGYGDIYYEGFSNPVDGDFYFIQEGLIFASAGTFSADYKFVPKDINNYTTYFGKVEIVVGKAYATISVSNNNFVYSEGFTIPTFTTNPKGLTYEHDIQYHDNDLVPAGTYVFRAWITSPNYEKGTTVFEFYVAKKDIDLSFVDKAGNVVRSYSTTYGLPLDAKIKLYEKGNSENKRGYLPADYINASNNAKITDTIEINYKSISNDQYYSSRSAPTNKGSYEVAVSIINNNYTASGTISYVVSRGIIQEIKFDTQTLEKQIYGSVVVAPTVTTIPTNVSYYIVYQGHDSMPKAAGTYNITVYFNDDNYEKSQVIAMFRINPTKAQVTGIQVANKVYDGVSSLSISGNIQGIVVGDEVSLEMTAHTLDNKTNVGLHYVEIGNYRVRGQDASNYVLDKPEYKQQISIYTKKVDASSNSSYVTSNTGFLTGTTMEVNVLDSKQNHTNAITKALGVETVIVGYTIKENGQETIIKDQVKVYISIPDEYKGTDFTYVGTGNLKDQNIQMQREGDYITFYATASGGVAFSKNEFKYGMAVSVISLLIILIGIAVLFILNPLKKRRSTMDLKAEKKAIKKIKRGY